MVFTSQAQSSIPPIVISSNMLLFQKYGEEYCAGRGEEEEEAEEEWNRGTYAPSRSWHCSGTEMLYPPVQK